MPLVLNEGQQQAVAMVKVFMAQDEVRFARVTGNAGTGKTTLIRELAKECGAAAVLTPTGKAALRVREASGVFAMTVHRFLYNPKEDPKTGRVTFELKSEWDDVVVDMEGSLVIIDEASMVDRALWADVMKVAERVGFYVLLIGDPFQLPPVSKDEASRGFSTLKLDTPFEVHLTEIHRQALESPIIRASVMLRSGAPEYEAMETLEPLGQNMLIPSIVEVRSRGGCAISFTNARRHKINTEVRQVLGFKPDTLFAREPILVTHNSYDLNVWNGEVLDYQGWEREPSEEDETSVLDRFTSNAMNVHFGVGRVAGQLATLAPEQFSGRAEAAHVGGSAIKKGGRRWYRDTFRVESVIPHLECNYGYALTCHKAQGSEWPEVIVVLEDRLGSLRGIEKKRWLYTAITRAKERVRYCYVEDLRN